jgi:hypothetical protein
MRAPTNIVMCSSHPGPLAKTSADGKWRGAQVPNSTWPEAPRALAKIAHRRRSPGQILVKYGRVKYLKEMRTRGAVRISPASLLW